MAGNQHTSKKQSLFTSAPISGKNPAKTETGNPDYSAEMVKPSAPKSAPNYNTPTAAAIQPVRPATLPK
jgi:hypothetical protein